MVLRKTSGMFAEWRDHFMEQKEQLLFGFPVKAALATALTVFVEFFGGNVTVLYIYIFFALADLLMGVFVSAVYGNFDPRRLGYWFRKMAGQAFFALGVGLCCQAYYQTSDTRFFITNWIIFLYIVVDFISVTHKLDKLGVPVGPWVKIFLMIARKKVATDISGLLKDPSARAEIEKALATLMAQEAKDTPGGPQCGPQP